MATRASSTDTYESWFSSNIVVDTDEELSGITAFSDLEDDVFVPQEHYMDPKKDGPPTLAMLLSGQPQAFAPPGVYSPVTDDEDESSYDGDDEERPQSPDGYQEGPQSPDGYSPNQDFAAGT